MLLDSGQVSEYIIFESDIQKDNWKNPPLYIEKRSIWLGKYALFLLWLDFELSDEDIIKLKELSHEHACVFLQIETLQYWETLEKTNKENYIKNGFQSEAYKKFIPTYTALIDLTLSPEEILANMKQKGRYNIKIATKHAVEVHEAEKNSENIQMFYRLMQETCSRDNFSGNSYSFYEKFLQQEQTLLVFAFHENTPLAAGIYIKSWDVMIYYYWASSSEKRNLMAPYLLHWQMIQKAKSLNCHYYDFLGVAAAWEKNSPLAWVTDFKTKFTKNTPHVSESFLFVCNKFYYYFFIVLKTTKHSIKKIKNIKK